MQRNRLLQYAVASPFFLSLVWTACPVAGQGPGVGGIVVGTPSPQVTVKVEPEEHGYVVYAPISESTSDRSGSDDGAQLSLKLLITNTGGSTLHLKSTTVKFAGPPVAASSAFNTDKQISASATATVHLQDNPALPGINFNFKLSDPPPHHVIFELKFFGYNEAVTVSRPLAPHQNAPPEGSYLFPAKEGDLAAGEFWSGASAGTSSHHTGDQRFDYDMGVIRWDAGEDEWTGLHAGTDGTQNEHYLCWGKPLYAVANGVVESLARTNPDHEPGEDGPANFINLRVGDEVVTYYHLRQNSIPALLVVGSPVVAGQKIGEVGDSGQSSHPHLHFGVRRSPVGMSPHLRPSLFRNIYLIDRTAFDPNDVGDSPWVQVNGKSLTWVRNAIWPSLVPPM
jgi:murein DD-endopeptidase MepM/ murein hydrolase activator NlpD